MSWRIPIAEWRIPIAEGYPSTGPEGHFPIGDEDTERGFLILRQQPMPFSSRRDVLSWLTLCGFARAAEPEDARLPGWGSAASRGPSFSMPFLERTARTQVVIAHGTMFAFFLCELPAPHGSATTHGRVPSWF